MSHLKHITTGKSFPAERFTDPDSVKRIMDLVGSRGVTNSPDGLCIYRTPEVCAQKGDWIGLLDGETLVHVSAGDPDYLVLPKGQKSM